MQHRAGECLSKRFGSARGSHAPVVCAASALLGLLATGADLDSVAQFLAGHAAGEQAIGELRRMLELSQDTAAAGRIRFDLALARGLGYYTGCIFELASPKFGGSLGGGGRYDNLIGLFLGRAVPACGLALGFERLLLLMEEGGLFPADLAAWRASWSKD